jgi:hypothetical protein
MTPGWAGWAENGPRAGPTLGKKRSKLNELHE